MGTGAREAREAGRRGRMGPTDAPRLRLRGGRMTLLKPCLDCGHLSRGSRCSVHTRTAELERQARQPYRAAYSSPEYRRARAERMKVAGGACEYVYLGGRRCGRAA